MAISLNPSQFGFLSPEKPSFANRDASPANPNATNAVSQPTSAEAREVSRADRQSAQQTADNMLGFIGRDIERLRAAGASEERIAERVAAAREGVAKGYAEGESILQGRGLLNDELQQELDAGRSLIEDGLDRLAAGESLAEINAPADQSGLPTAIEGRSQLNVANSLSLEVFTRDGDRVTVSFAQSESRSSSFAPGQISVSSSSQSGYELSVEGNLDEDEKSALTSLFDSVQDLSERFFSGDLGGALEQAMELGFDGNELASLSLNLTQQTFASSTRAYSDIQPQLPTEQLESLKSPLASYVDAYVAAIDKASALEKPEDTLQQLVNQLLPEEDRLPIWNEFHQGLQAATNLAGLFQQN